MRIVLESDLNRAHVVINKDGNSNKAVGNGIEYVLKDDVAVNETKALGRRTCGLS